MLVDKAAPRERRDGRLNRLDLTGTDSEITEAFNDIADLNSGLKIELERVAMEACAPSHYWARELLAMGHDVRLIPPIYVKPYVKRGKNDAADAAAVCEAMSRPGMRFVPVIDGKPNGDMTMPN